MGGPGSERAVSLVSAQAVAGALRQAGYTHVYEVDVHGADFTLPSNTELAYNVIHGTFGEDGAVQAILEQRGIPYTGAGRQTSELAFDKIKSKAAFLSRGVPTPRSEVLDCSQGVVLPSLPLPLVIKPPCEGSSVGVHIVRNESELMPAMQDAMKYGAHVLVEEFVQGMELTVGILDGVALPVVHISPRSGFYDINNKYPWMNHLGGTDYYCPADLPPHISQQVQQAALDAYHALGIEVYGRADVLLRESDNVPFVLEINTIPGMTPTSLLPKAAATVGISYEQLCERIAQISSTIQR